MKLGKNYRGRMLIGGELVESESGGWLESVNPATEEVIGHVPEGLEGRARALRSVAAELLERADEVLGMEVQDTGNTITQMRRDVHMAVDGLDYYIGLGYQIKGETIPATPGGIHMTLREPYGVVGRIVPFNHPILFAAARTAAALVAGNAVVIKPPETSPLSATIYAEICQKHLPPGVINIVTGLGSVAGDAMARHPDVRRIAFIGSPQTGMAIQRAAAETCVKNITLELGGKNPLIVFPDARMDDAVDAAVRGMNFAWQGQSCGSTSRLLLHESIHDEFLDRVIEKVSRIRVGDPLSEASQMGPVNSRRQYEKVLGYIDIAHADGARLVAGGKRPSGEAFAKGYWVEPTVFAGVTQDMRIANEEVFGPVLSVLKWRNVDEAVEMANATEYGLTGAVWSQDIDRAMGTARRIRSGYVWINGVGTHYKAVPFGGMKNSGVGREEGIEELLSYTETKAMHVVLRDSFSH